MLKALLASVCTMRVCDVILHLCSVGLQLQVLLVVLVAVDCELLSKSCLLLAI